MSTRPSSTARLNTVLAVAMILVTLAVFAYNVRQQAFVGDDAYISFRYARHVAEGLGPVWNPGERVEGYTNFSWVMAMAVAIRTGLDPEIVAPAVGIACGLLVLFGVALTPGRRLGPLSPWIWIAPMALASGRSFSAWCTGGLETMAFTAIVWFAFDRWSVERARGAGPPWVSAALFALAVLTRPEGLLFAAVAGCVSTAALLRRRQTLRDWSIWVAILSLPVLAHLLWRHSYYGFWLPNTFYAKVPGAWWDQGLHYLRLFHTDYRFGWFLPLAVWGAWKRPDQRAHAFAAVLYLTYVAYVGGDRFEFRFLVPVLPLATLLVVEGLVALHDGGSPSRSSPWRGPAVVLAIGLLATTALGSRSLAADHDRNGVASLNTIAGYAARRAAEGRFLRRQIDAGRLPADLVVCVGGAGAVPYFTGWPVVDRRGINDTFIAHQPLAVRGVVAHERDAPLSYMRERGVVIFDRFNRLVHTRDITRGRPPFVEFDGERLPVLALPVENRFLIFATPASAEDLQRHFGELP